MDKSGTARTGKTKRLLLWCIVFLALAGMVYAIIAIVSDIADTQAHRNDEVLLRTAAAADETAIPTEPMATASPTELAVEPTKTQLMTPDPNAWPGIYAQIPDKAVNFDTLHETNPDICAWISVSGTSIDHPVVFAPKGDERYISHDIAGNESKHGAIFFDGYNSMDFSDPITVVYGHNMKDGSMFASLHWFESAAFFDENRTIRVYIDDYMLEYEIVAAYKTSDTHILAVYDFTDPDVFMEYMNGVYSIRDMSAMLREYSLTADSRVITLATCVQGEPSARYLVQGVLKTND